MRRTIQQKELLQIQKEIASCRLCDRLVRWREEAAQIKVPRFIDEHYWGKPVPSFGDPAAQLLIVGLAPAAHGANRTGRMFTGDRSGEWLFRALHKAGYANQASSTAREDGLELTNCYITASVRCAPPGNKPFPQEFSACRPYLLRELQLLKNVRVILGLGKSAFDTAFDTVKASQKTTLVKRPKFSHGAHVNLNDIVTLVGSYHPSQQNTFTGKLTEKMFDGVFGKVGKYLSSK